MTEEINHDWNGLASYALDICKELIIEGLFDHQVSKSKFKERVKKSCTHQNEVDLRSQISTYKKMGAIRDEIVKGNDYFLF